MTECSDRILISFSKKDEEKKIKNQLKEIKDKKDKVEKSVLEEVKGHKTKESIERPAEKIEKLF